MMLEMMLEDKAQEAQELPRDAQVAHQMVRLTAVMTEITDEIRRLEDRLSAVLTPPSPDVNATNEKSLEELVPLAADLVSLHDTAQFCVRGLARLYDRIKL